MKPREKNKQFQRKLHAYNNAYEQVKANIKDVGFICAGSFVERRLTCGNPQCRCHKNPRNLHGPYWQLSWKEKGKTVSRFLSPKEVEFYREWIDNRRRLVAIMATMNAISQKAIDCIFEQKKSATKVGKAHPIPKRKSRK